MRVAQLELMVSHLYVEQCGSSPHGLTDLQAVYELRETGRTLVVGGQYFDIHRSDGTSEETKRNMIYIPLFDKCIKSLIQEYRHDS